MLYVCNWAKWQSYRKDRGQPPWIKLHRCLMRNEEWVKLDDYERGQIVCLWLLAADNNGQISDDPVYLQRVCMLSNPINIDRLIDLGFLKYSNSQELSTGKIIDYDKRNAIDNQLNNINKPDVDVNVTPIRRQHDATETETETETETKTERPPLPPLGKKSETTKPEKPKSKSTAPARKHWAVPEWINITAWNEFEDHRRDIRKPMTNTARTKAANKLKGYNADEQQACIDNTIQARWTGLFPEKQNGNHTQQKRNPLDFHAEVYKNFAARSLDGSAVRENEAEIWPPVEQPVRRIAKGH